MSSPTIRTAIKAQLAAFWSALPVLDLSDYEPVLTEPSLLLQFIGGTDRLATIGQIENHSWKEQGVVVFHLALPLGESSGRALTLGEELVQLFRGKRFGVFVVDYMEHFSDFNGAAIQLNGPWHGWSANLGYTSVICA